MTGVYGLKYNLFPFGDLFERNINIRTGQAPVIHLIPELYEQIRSGRFDPTDIITHRLPLDQGEHGYKIFNDKEENCIKVVLKP